MVSEETRSVLTVTVVRVCGLDSRDHVARRPEKLSTFHRIRVQSTLPYIHKGVCVCVCVCVPTWARVITANW